MSGAATARRPNPSGNRNHQAITPQETEPEALRLGRRSAALEALKALKRGRIITFTVQAADIAAGQPGSVTMCPIAIAAKLAIGGPADEGNKMPAVFADQIHVMDRRFSITPELRHWIMDFDKRGREAVQPVTVELGRTDSGPHWARLVDPDEQDPDLAGNLFARGYAAGFAGNHRTGNDQPDNHKPWFSTDSAYEACGYAAGVQAALERESANREAQ